MRLRQLSLLALLACAPALPAQDVPSMPDIDRVRIAEAFRLADAVQDKIWPSWSTAPFAVVLVTPKYEYLMRHPNPSSDFTLIGYDSVLKEKVWVRERQYSISFLATFPAVNGLPTIVIGEAEYTTSKTSTPWVVTLLHEHFHQLQYSHPGYYDGVTALGLAHGDQSGMWMLNFPFPYADSSVQAKFTAAARALGAALRARGQPGFADAVAAFRRDDKSFLAKAGTENAKYFSFELWQEGIARYTEYRVASAAAKGYEPGAEFKALKDYTPYSATAAKLLGAIEAQLANEKLGADHRTVVYNFGAAMGLVLDRVNGGWQAKYFAEPFALEPYFRN
jgi:hypothetical protein